jgi:hypothetical protein
MQGNAIHFLKHMTSCTIPVLGSSDPVIIAVVLNQICYVVKG